MSDSPDVQTGAAAFGPTGRVGILTKSDSAQLLRLALLGALAHPEEGFAIRALVKRMLGFISDVDCLVLANLMDTACSQQKEWASVATLLRHKAGQ